MKAIKRLTKSFIYLGILSALPNIAVAEEPVKIGFLVKQPEEPWF